MSCAACSARVERALKLTPGVENAAVNLLTNSASVEGTASVDELVRAIRQAGYDAIAEGSSAESDETTDGNLEAQTLRRMTRRLVASAFLALLLFYLSTCVGMLHFPIPQILTSPGATGLAQFLLATAVIIVNQRLFLDGFASLWRMSPNMNALVALGSGASYLYSIAVLFAIVDALSTGALENASSWSHDLYFESTAVILVFVSLGKTLETYSKGKTTTALRALAELAPPKATVVRNGEELLIGVEEMEVGDVFLVRPGGRVPADGVVVEGVSAIDESTLTGESVPVDKGVNSDVSAGSLNLSGFLRCKATRVGKNTALSQIIQLTADAAASKAPVSRIADRISSVFVPSVIGIALLTCVVWLICGSTFEFALLRGVSTLLISCPCALGLATPAAIIVGTGLGARRGILFKTAEALENAGKCKIVTLDKTGVVTEGKPVVTDVQASDKTSVSELLSVAVSLESKSEHPLARAVVDYVDSLTSPIQRCRVEDFHVVAGNGLEGILNGKRVSGGKFDFIRRFAEVPQELQESGNKWNSDGKTTLFFEIDGEILGAFAVADSPRETSAVAIEQLKALKTRVVMLTGDSNRVAESIGKRVGVEEIYADVLPSGKESIVRELSAQGRVAFVGDGINDAPAITRADVGIAVGAGTNVAIDAADIVLVNNNLEDLCRAIRLSRSTLANIKENLFWAFIYNIIGIPLASGLFTPIFGWTLSPVFGALAMSMSSFCVVSNALRLNFAKIDGPRRSGKSTANQVDRAITKASIVKGFRNKTDNPTKEYTMKKTMIIEGMMCGHCEARVKKALESLPFVSTAEVSHIKGEAIVELNDVPADVDIQLKNAVEAQDYTVRSVE